MNIKTKFSITDSVILIHDRDKLRRVITGISIRQDSRTYNLQCGTSDTWHYEFEIEMAEEKEKTKTGFRK